MSANSVDCNDYRLLLVKYMKLVLEATGSDHLMGLDRLQFSDAELEQLEECSVEAYLEEGE